VNGRMVALRHTEGDQKGDLKYSKAIRLVNVKSENMLGMLDDQNAAVFDKLCGYITADMLKLPVVPAAFEVPVPNAVAKVPILFEPRTSH
jgi:hypothetical protein